MYLCLGITAELLVLPPTPLQLVELGNVVVGSGISTSHRRNGTTLVDSASDVANNMVLGTRMPGNGAGGSVSGAMLTAISTGRAMTSIRAIWTGNTHLEII